MSAKEIRAGRAFVEVSIRDKLAQGLRGAWAKLKAFAGMVKTAFFAVTGALASIGAALAAVVTPIVSMSRRFADAGSELHDMAARTGVAVETLSAMKFAAEQTGASLGDVEKALRTMAKKGIPVEKFEGLAKAISAIEDPSERAAAAMQVFGKSGTALLPMLREWDALRTRAQQLGLFFTTEDAERADELGDSFSELAAVFDMLKVKTGSAFAPAMLILIRSLTTAVVQLGKAMAAISTGFSGMAAGIIAAANGVAMAMKTIVDSIAGFLEGAEAVSGKDLGSGAVRGAGAAIGAAMGGLGAAIGGGGFERGSAMEDLMDELGKAAASAFGTFSSPGASLAGRAGGAIDSTNKKILGALEKIAGKLGKLDEINQGIQDLEPGMQ